MARTYTILNVFHTTDSNNIFVRSKTCNNVTIHFMRWILFVLAIVIGWMFIFGLMIFGHGCDEEIILNGTDLFSNISDVTPNISTCLRRSLWILNAFLWGGLISYWIAIYLIIPCINRVSDELKEPNNLPHQKRYRFLTFFQTSNPNNIFIKSNTCNVATENTIMIMYCVICVAAPTLGIYFGKFNKSEMSGGNIFMGILTSFLGGTLLGSVIILVTMGILFLISKIIQFKENVEDELEEMKLVNNVQVTYSGV